MADNLQATPRNQLLGLLSDAMYGGLDWMKDPQRTQQMQGLAGLLESTGIPKTTERMAYGEPLTNIGRANVPLLKPETAEALMNVTPLAPVAGKAGKGIARMAGSEINAAMMGERGGLLGALTPQPKQIFIGENAKTWNKAGADKFLQLEKSGADPVTAWQQTGTFRSPDGKLRQEISDVSAIGKYDLTPEQLNRELDLNAQLTYGKPYQHLDRATKNKLKNEVNDFQASLNQNLTHPELYRAYPELANIESTAEFANIPRGRLEQTRVSSIGAGNVPVNERIVGERMTSQAPTEEQLKSVLLHETQHAIQNRENFARGGDYGSRIGNIEAEQMAQKYMNTFWPIEEKKGRNFVDVWDDAMRWVHSPSGGQFERYRNIAGEAESRAVQNRMNMTPEQRLQKFPLESYDVPAGSLLFPTP